MVDYPRRARNLWKPRAPRCFDDASDAGLGEGRDETERRITGNVGVSRLAGGNLADPFLRRNKQ